MCLEHTFIYLFIYLKFKWQHIDDEIKKYKTHCKKHGSSQDVEGYTKYGWYDAITILTTVPKLRNIKGATN